MVGLAGQMVLLQLVPSSHIISILVTVWDQEVCWLTHLPFLLEQPGLGRAGAAPLLLLWGSDRWSGRWNGSLGGLIIQAVLHFKLLLVLISTIIV